MFRRIIVVLLLAHALAVVLAAQRSRPAIPRTWDDEAVAALEVPLANAEFSPKHVSSDYYYRIPVRPVYKTYPVYAPDREPPGYMEWLAKQEPEIVFDPATLHTEADWIRAGELVFDAPINFEPLAASAARFPEFYAKSGVRLAADGTLPNKSYVIREKGTVEVGNLSCGQCHTRVMPDGTVVKGAQGNFTEGFFFAARPRRALQDGRRSPDEFPAPARSFLRRVYGAPWIQPPPEGDPAMSHDAVLSALEAQPPGVAIRQGTSLRYPAQVPDLIGIKDRLYLDHTGLVRHRSVGDLMRYAALNQGMDLLARYGDFVPDGEVPDPSARRRYSDEQLYALAMYIYSRKPPPNPNKYDKYDAVAAKGEAVFEREECARCHTPPLYTNNKLTPADGFTIPKGHIERFDIRRGSVGTDPNSALKTRRGTGYYRVPSLKGVWYRGPFEHNGSVATLEDWFDPRRLDDDYVPTGHIGYGFKTRAVKGHEFGLDLSADDKKALIAFLKTL